MAQSQSDAAAYESSRQSSTTTSTKHTTVPIDPKAAGAATAAVPPPPPSSSSSPTATPCGACKFLRRKCISGCIFAPYFGSDQGAAKFAAVHKVFGASNVSKLLVHIPVNQRHDAVVTISYEAQARLSDPVYGCISTIIALKQQVTALQSELAMVEAQLISSRLAVANAIQSSQQQQQQAQHTALMMQPAYSNNSSASNNLVNINGFVNSFEFEADAAPSSHSLEPLGFSSKPSQYEEDDEEESHNHTVLIDQIIPPQ